MMKEKKRTSEKDGNVSGGGDGGIFATRKQGLG